MASNPDAAAPEAPNSSFASQVSGFNEFVSRLSYLNSNYNYVHIKDLNWHRQQLGDRDLEVLLGSSRGPERLPISKEDASCSWLVVLNSERGGMTPHIYPVHPDWVEELSRDSEQVRPFWSQVQSHSAVGGQTVGYLRGMSGFPVIINGWPMNVPLFPEASLYTPIGQPPPTSTSSYAS